MRNQTTDTDAIEKCTIKLFYENGYDNCSIRQISNLANSSHSTLIRYYKTKAALGFLFLERYITVLTNLTLKFGDTCRPDSKKNQDLLLFYWCLHHFYLYNDHKLRKFYMELYCANFKQFNEFHYTFSESVYTNLFNMEFDKTSIQTEAVNAAICAIEGTLIGNIDTHLLTYEEFVYLFLSSFFQLNKLNFMPNQTELDVFIQKYINNPLFVKYDTLEHYVTSTNFL